MSHLGRGDEAAAADEERRLKEALGQDGRADLSVLEFAPGSAALEPGADRYLASVARVLAMEENAFLVEGRVGLEEPPAEPSLGKQRAAAVKVALVAAGIPAIRLFSVGRREPSGAAVVSLVRIQ